jgi:hypothetical protein
MEFILKISLGNEAMLSREDVGAALESVGRRLRHTGGEFNVTNFPYLVRDANGNKVGTWEVVA